MKRKDLALKLNLKESVISDIENGKQLYDGGIVHKLKKLFPTL
jgi:ribosome-binding protein aMBF1 (putative translation factor)